jgi:hypothetical protein
MKTGLTLQIVEGEYSICRLPLDSPIPAWATREPFYSTTATAEELSVVCKTPHVPSGVRREDGWKALRVAGPLDFSLTGILAALANPLAENGISIFAVSTFDTDYLLVRASDFAKAVSTLEAAGFAFA